MKHRSRKTYGPCIAVGLNYCQPLPINDHRFLVPEAVNKKSTNFVKVTPCSLVASYKTTRYHITEDSELHSKDTYEVPNPFFTSLIIKFTTARHLCLS
jgi:hypothetical protein